MMVLLLNLTCYYVNISGLVLVREKKEKCSLYTTIEDLERFATILLLFL